jgi:spore maturation protein CgeB
MLETLDQTRMEAAIAPLRIAYIGPVSGTSLQRARALERLGHTVLVVDPARYLPRLPLVPQWLYHAGGAGAGVFIDRPIFNAVQHFNPTIIWVDQGDYLGSGTLRQLRKLRVPIINYTIDDPFGRRDRRRFNRYMTALPEYDLLAVVREENLAEARAHGARNVLRVWRSADEIAHAPRPLTDRQRETWASDVCFIGTWMPERGPFMAALTAAGIPLSIWGDHWQKAAEWNVIAPAWRGPGVYNPDDYAAIIQSAKICLGLLSKGNRDRHTTRSMEIPALGGLLCAERTGEHMRLYRDGEEAAFWDDTNECVAVCQSLLADDDRRSRLAAAGQRRAQKNGYRNENVMSLILSHALGQPT